ncbi:molecular chaperone DnaK [Streptomyces daghestanicus]|uniref:Molecular chaperone DnaK n=3 Tax=Streptomyces TaxID=1883 RepID=A0A918GH44_STRGD|nr:molecular chaperone DnaK [Streptomyces niveoruber]GGS98642.1 molecular chaperone DnaK [Streptomyces griseoviridis]GGU41858.1 molecular chaperone DnaK [Streptomyces daghestanicus]GHI28809.1 molecular chaperone DnaK [Streptomyces daghestanicus]
MGFPDADEEHRRGPGGRPAAPVRKALPMSPDTSRTDARAPRMSAQDARRRLEHARDSRLAQLRALDAGGRDAADHPLSAQAEAIGRDLKEIDEAFARVEDGTYGRCLGCAKPVPVERLEILPYTRYCVGCRRRAAV